MLFPPATFSGVSQTLSWSTLKALILQVAGLVDVTVVTLHCLFTSVFKLNAVKTMLEYRLSRGITLVHIVPFFYHKTNDSCLFVGQYIKIKVFLWYIADFMWSRRRIKLTTVNRARVCCCILTSVIVVVFGRTLVLHIQQTDSCIFMMCIRELCCSIISSLPLTLTQTDTHHLEPLAAAGHAESHLPLILMLLSIVLL